MLSNMANSLIEHKRIFTTTAKAKELRGFIEPLITKAKMDSTHSRRVVFSYLQSKEAIMELFGTVAEKVADRPGGYTRIFKTHRRLGDNAEMCMMELVDFNELMLDQKVSKKTTGAAKRTRRGRKKAEDTVETSTPAAIVAVDEMIEDTVEVEVVEETVEVTEEVAEEVAEEAVEVAEEAIEETPEATTEVVEEVEAKAEEVAEEVAEETTESDSEESSDEAEPEDTTPEEGKDK